MVTWHDGVDYGVPWQQRAHWVPDFICHEGDWKAGFLSVVKRVYGGPFEGPHMSVQ